MFNRFSLDAVPIMLVLCALSALGFPAFSNAEDELSRTIKELNLPPERAAKERDFLEKLRRISVLNKEQEWDLDDADPKLNGKCECSPYGKEAKCDITAFTFRPIEDGYHGGAPAKPASLCITLYEKFQSKMNELSQSCREAVLSCSAISRRVEKDRLAKEAQALGREIAAEKQKASVNGRDSKDNLQDPGIPSKPESAAGSRKAGT